MFREQGDFRDSRFAKVDEEKSDICDLRFAKVDNEEASASFAGSVFDGPALFRGACFPGPVLFQDARFNKEGFLSGRRVQRASGL